MSRDTRRLAAVSESDNKGRRARHLRALLGAVACLVLVCLAAAILIQTHIDAQAPQHPIAQALPTATDFPTSTATTAPTATAKPTPKATPAKYLPPTVKQGGGGAPPPAPTVAAPPAGPDPYGGVPNISGQLILVNIAQQWLWVYQDRKLVYRTPVTTGMPELPTPTGMFSVRFKESNITFYSPWPPGSPYYYSPEHINYAMYFADDGYYIHDAPWRKCFGPGTNVPHTCPDGSQDTGSHGCVNVPTPAGAWIYKWVHNGAKVDIVNVRAPATPTPTPSPVPPTPTPTDVPATPTPTETPTP